MLGVAAIGLVTMLAGLAFSDISNMPSTAVPTRFFTGGACLFLAAMAGGGFYAVIATGKAPYFPSWWSSRCEMRHRSAYPTRFWFHTVLFAVNTLAMLVLSLLGFLGYWP